MRPRPIAPRSPVTSRSSSSSWPRKIASSRKPSPITGRHQVSSTSRAFDCAGRFSKDIERGRREIISDLLEVLDNLDRAIEAAHQPTAQPEALLKGIEMVHRQFVSKLEGLGVTRIDVGTGPFDPAVHEAVTTVPASPAAQDGTIVGIIRHGYSIGGDVLRPAAVAVAQASRP